MEIFGTSIENIYLFILIISGLLTIMYLFFGDFLEAFGDFSPFFNPALILAFITFLSATAYILELVTSLSSMAILIIAGIIAFILAAVLNIFVFVPIRSAEESLSYTEDSLKGRVGKIILTIPVDGYGEIIIESKSGTISKPAASYENEEIPEGKQVLVIDVKDGVLFVTPYENELDMEPG